MSKSSKSSVGKRFDYAGLPDAVVVALKRDAANIRFTVDEIGRYLLEAKDLLPHGRFLAWVVGETGLSVDTAQRMMRAYRAAEKNRNLRLLKKSARYQLAARSTPDEVRAVVDEKIATGEQPSNKEIKRLVDERKKPSLFVINCEEQAKPIPRSEPEAKSVKLGAIVADLEERTFRPRREAAARIRATIIRHLSPDELVVLIRDLRIIANNFCRDLADAIEKEARLRR